ncbi:MULTISPECIES: YafY family protein [unclassified Clostridium]|uniref:helix-turn-helix transcriptional regulator n=1 Tax=Clostridium sp. LS TaxID=1352601 RepID=UPI000559332D|nr:MULTISPECIES: YafY family protein [unclassified Clostridium]
MKIDRLIGIITILLQNDKVTAPFLAEKFQVSRRTINRDIEDICKAGIPIVTMQGYDGGISIAEGYKIDKTIFTSEELQSIFIGLKSLDSVSQISYTDRLIDKLSAKKNSVFSITNNILIDLSSHYKNSLVPKVDIIKTAINKQITISFRYYYAKGETDRLIEPYLLVFKWSSWYVFGYCLDKKDFRLFKLNRLWNLYCTQQTFECRELPEDRMDFDDYFSEEIKLVAIFDESVKYRLIEEYGIDSFTCIDNGKLLFKARFTSKENLINWILGFGDTAEIIKPKEIRSEIKKHALNIFNKYK